MQGNPDRRPRALVLVTYGLSVRYVVPTGVLAGLRSVCDPVVGLGWPDEELAASIAAQGVGVVQLPVAEMTHDYRMLRRRLGLLRDRRLGGPTVAIRRRRERLVRDRREVAIGLVRRMRDQVLLSLPGRARQVEESAAQHLLAGTNVAAFVQFLDEQQIDVVVSLTPYHEQDELALWAARVSGRPSITSVISFDNPTTRGPLPVRSELVLVWNRHNERELRRGHPDLSAEQVRVVGAPQFDLHHRRDLIMTRADWCSAMGLDVDRPVVLYGAGPQELVPGEERLVALIDEILESEDLPGDPVLLVRRHPVDPPDRWSGIAERLHRTIVVDPWAEGPDAFRSWPTDQDIELQMSTLAHCAVHVNVCSSMSLDGAVFDRPQICPTFVPAATRDELRRLRDFYGQEHWLPVARSGGVHHVDNRLELSSALRTALEQPGLGAAGRRRLVLDLLSFDDGQSTRRLVDQVAEFLDASGQSTSPR